MLAPRDSRSRDCRRLDGLWRFALDPGAAGRRERWWAGPLAGAREMPVPASYNDIYPDAALRDHVGDAWYQTLARVPAGWAGERIVLRFDAATQTAEALLRQMSAHRELLNDLRTTLSEIRLTLSGELRTSGATRTPLPEN